MAAAVAAVAPRPGPAVQPGTRRSSSCARGADSLSWQPGGAGPEERRGGDEPEPSREGEWLGAGPRKEAGLPKGVGRAGPCFCDLKLGPKPDKGENIRLCDGTVHRSEN